MNTASSRLARVSVRIAAILVLAFTVLPTLIVVPLSFSGISYFALPPPSWSTEWYHELFNRQSGWIDAILHTLIVGCGVAALATVLGAPAAVGLVRGRFPGRKFLRHALVLPMYVPVMALAVGFYVLFARVHMIGSLYAIILAHTVIAMPLVLLSVLPALETLDIRIEAAAQSLGASPVRAFFAVTVPAIRGSVLVGAALAFAISFDELVIALFVSGPSSVTLPVRMWQGIQFEQTPVVAAAASVLLGGICSVFVLLQVSRIALAGRQELPPVNALPDNPEGMVR